jgi:cell division transport system permease protein
MLREEGRTYRFRGTWRAGRSNWRLQVLSIFSLAVAFVCLASALLVVSNLSAVRDRWSRAGRATVYLRDGATEADVKALVKALEASAGVQRVRYVSRDMARSEVLEGSGDTELAALPPEAFPSSIELSLTDGIGDMELNMMALKLRALPSVDMVDTYQKWTERLSSLLHGAVTASLLLALVVLGAVVSVVASTMRLLLERRRTEVEVLRLVGATSRFVCRPFVVEGAMQGALGATTAVFGVGALYAIVRSRFDQQLASLLGISPSFMPLSMVLGMIAAGAVLGAAAAWLSIRKTVQI